VTAVFCANDELALGLIRAMHEQGRRVPTDVSVVGFDGLDVGEYSFPPLTTVRQDFRRHGREMVSLVLEQAGSGTRDGGRSVIIPYSDLVAEAGPNGEEGLDADSVLEMAQPVVQCILKPGYPFALGASILLPQAG